MLTAASFSARICLSPFFFLTGAAAAGVLAFFASSSEDASQSSSASSSSSPSNLLFLETMGGARVGRALAGLAVLVVAGASLSETSMRERRGLSRDIEATKSSSYPSRRPFCNASISMAKASSTNGTKDAHTVFRSRQEESEHSGFRWRRWCAHQNHHVQILS